MLCQFHLKQPMQCLTLHIYDIYAEWFRATFGIHPPLSLKVPIGLQKVKLDQVHLAGPN